LVSTPPLPVGVSVTFDLFSTALITVDGPGSGTSSIIWNVTKNNTPVNTTIGSPTVVSQGTRPFCSPNTQTVSSIDYSSVITITNGDIINITSTTVDTITNGQVGSQTNCTTNINTQISAVISSPTIVGNTCSSVIGSSRKVQSNEITYVPIVVPLPLEEFTMNAVGINQIDGPGTTPGFQITSSLGFQINWGDGVVTQYSAGSIGASHSYSSPYTGPIILLSSNLTSITNFSAESSPHPNQSLWVSTNELNKLDGLIYFQSTNSDAMFVTGDVINLPNSLTTFYTQYNNLSGNTSNLPPLLINCTIAGVNTISGNTSGLPTGLTFLVLTGNNTISGNTSGLSAISTVCIVSGNNTISGDTSNLPNSTQTVDITGNNTISGDTSGLPNPTNSLIIKGNNTISGDTSGLSNPTATIVIWGNNTISGNVSNLPTSVTQLDIYGNNTITGNISGLPPNLSYFRLQGGFSTVFGNISTLPIGLIQIYLVTLGTLTGDLYYLPTTMKIIDITSPMNFTYTSGRSWSNGFITLYLAPTNGWSGFNQSQTDNLLIDTQPKYIYIPSLSRFVIKCSGTPKRTATSDAAFTALQTLIGPANVILN